MREIHRNMGSCAIERKPHKARSRNQGMSNAQALLLGLVITLGIMLVGVVVFYDHLQSLDVIGAAMAFFLIYCGVVAMLS